MFYLLSDFIITQTFFLHFFFKYFYFLELTFIVPGALSQKTTTDVYLEYICCTFSKLLVAVIVPFASFFSLCGKCYIKLLKLLLSQLSASYGAFVHPPGPSHTHTHEI